MYKRVLLKISGEALSATGQPVHFDTVLRTAQGIAALHAAGVQLGVVVGGGNVMRGRTAKEQERNRLDHMGMLATAINALALEDALERLGIPACTLSAVAMERFCDTYSARKARALLDANTVVLFACGTGCPYFSTDTAAALRAAEIGADTLLLAKNVDAVYSADPKVEPNATRYARLSYDKVISERLQATDLTAITLCREQNIPILVFALDQLDQVASGATIGTRIDA